MTKPQAAVNALLTEYELTETQIVERLSELGVKTSQPTINRIKRGQARNLRWEVGAALVKLHERLQRKPRSQEVRATA